MFVQGDTSLERSRGGLGLGLTLVKQFVEAHGGTAHAASDGIGRGSELELRLPLPEQPARLVKHDGSPAEPTEYAEQQPTSGAQRRILVVDDNEDGSEALAIALGFHGHDVRTTHDGPAALALAAAWQPEIVLLDIGLPGMNGYEVARRMGEQPWRRGMRLIALTGWGQAADRLRSAEAGFDAHLVKPVELETLIKLLDAAPAQAPR
jgi:CheY-like chemotaxis protein